MIRFVLDKLPTDFKDAYDIFCPLDGNTLENNHPFFSVYQGRIQMGMFAARKAVDVGSPAGPQGPGAEAWPLKSLEL